MRIPSKHRQIAILVLEASFGAAGVVHGLTAPWASAAVIGFKFTAFNSFKYRSWMTLRLMKLVEKPRLALKVNGTALNIM